MVRPSVLKVHPWNSLPFYEVTDINEFIELSPCGDYVCNFEDKLFNPLLMANDDRESPEYDNLSNLLMNKCDYQTLTSFNNTLNARQTSNFSIMHANIRSLPQNIWRLKNVISSLDKPIHAIALSETWLNKTTEENYKDFGNYRGYFKSRTSRGGGVGIFVHKSYDVKERKDLTFHNGNCETLTVEIIMEKTKNILITTIYKAPNVNIEEFNHDLDVFLSKVTRENKISYFAGDYNIDLLKIEQHQPTEDVYNIFKSYNHYPLIYRPTRVTSTSATLIDNIFTNDYNIDKSGIIAYDISDHFIIFATNKIISTTSKSIKVTSRKINDTNLIKFKTLLQSEEWLSILNEQDTNKAYELFDFKIKSYYEECFPQITKTIKLYNDNKNPWITPAIINSIRTKSKLYKKYLRNRSKVNEDNYKTYNKLLKQAIKNAQKNFYQNKFTYANGNIKKNWDVINEILNRKKDKQSTKTNSFLHNNKEITDNKEIANQFNNFFATVGKNLADKIPKSNKKPLDFMTALGNQESTIFVEPVVEPELNKELSSLKSSAAGHDGLHPSVIKKCPDLLSTPLLHIFNRSFEQGIFPDKLKLALVTPIYKKEEHNLFTNYRPISVLPVFSKILEKLMQKRISNFITRLEILYLNQYGFRENRSTSMAILTFVEKIKESLDNCNFSIGLFLDFSKAFDTIDHDILLEKLNFYGIRGLCLSWIKSYLTNRTQKTLFNGTSSTSQNITCGVPQGSVLGPLFFIMYINDIYLTSPKLFFVLFADDTNILISGNNINELQNILNQELKVIQSWLIANKLSLNVGKTKYIIFSTTRKKFNSKNIKIYMNDQELEQVSDIKFLGITIDKHLTWKKHIQTIKTKISRTVGILFKVRDLLNRQSCMTIYNSLIYSYLNYCNIIWGDACVTAINSLLLIQKRFVRLCTNSEFLAHSYPLFKELKVLTIFDIFKLNQCEFLFKWKNNINNYQTIYQDFFSKHCDIHQHNTRFRQNFRRPKTKNAYGDKLIKVSALDAWNAIPDDIKNSFSKPELKNAIKKHYLLQYN